MHYEGHDHLDNHNDHGNHHHNHHGNHHNDHGYHLIMIMEILMATIIMIMAIIMNQWQVETKDALLHAISEQYVEAFEVHFHHIHE